MKRYGYKEFIELMKNDIYAYIRVDTMPFKTIYPQYAVMSKERITNDRIYGFMTSTTFYKLLDNKIIEKRASNFADEIYF